MQKLMTFAAFVAVAIFLGTLVYTVPNADKAPDDPSPPVTPTPDTPVTPDPSDTDTPDTPDKPVPPVTPVVPDTPVKPVEPDAPKRPALPTVEPVAIDGGDIAAFLNLKLAKFRVTVPDGKYTVHVWAERWRRGEETPDEIILTEFGTEVDAVDIVAQLPTESAPDDGFLKVNALVARPRKPVVPGGAFYAELKKPTAFDLGSDLHLLTYTWNAEGRATGGLTDVHKDHDLTIYLKARLIPGAFTPFKKPEPAPAGAPETNAPLTAPDTEIE